MNTASPFNYMATTLASVAVHHAPPTARGAGRTHVDAMRDALRSGPLSAADLARAGGVHSAMVMALLKGDIAIGRVDSCRLNGVKYYRLVDDFEQQVQQQLKAARRLLEQHGYDVYAPGEEQAAQRATKGSP